MNARKGKTKPFKKRRDFRHNDTKPVHPGFSPEPNKGQGMGSPTGKDPLIPLLQELRDRKDSEPYIAATLQKIVVLVEHERERGLDYWNLDAAVRRILVRPLTDAEAELVGKL